MLQDGTGQQGIGMGAVAVKEGDATVALGLVETLPAIGLALDIPFAIELGIEVHDAKARQRFVLPRQPRLTIRLR